MPRILVTYPGNGDVVKVQFIVSADELQAIANGVKVAAETELDAATEGLFAEISVVDEAHVQTEVQPETAGG